MAAAFGQARNDFTPQRKLLVGAPKQRRRRRRSEPIHFCPRLIFGGSPRRRLGVARLRSLEFWANEISWKSEYYQNWRLSELFSAVKRLKVKRYSSPEQVISELQGVTCHMGSHSVTCRPTQVNQPRRNPGHTGWYPAGMEGWVDLGD